jgi:hypothetical protein
MFNPFNRRDVMSKRVKNPPHSLDITPNAEVDQPIAPYKVKRGEVSWRFTNSFNRPVTVALTDWKSIPFEESPPYSVIVGDKQAFLLLHVRGVAVETTFKYMVRTFYMNNGAVVEWASDDPDLIVEGSGLPPVKSSKAAGKAKTVRKSSLKKGKPAKKR